MAKLRHFLDWQTWLRGIWSAIIQGGSSAVLGSLGALGGNMVGVDMKPLDYKQMGAVFIGAAVIRLLFYLNTNSAPVEVTESVPTDAPFPESESPPKP